MHPWNTQDEHRARLALHLIPGLGNKLAIRLLGHFGSASAIFEASRKEVQEIEGVGPLLSERLAQGPPRQRFAEIEQQLARQQVWVLHYKQAPYPDALYGLSSPPLLLYGKGNRQILKQKMLSIVGTRSPDAYGKRLTNDLVASLYRSGMVICSGGAEGIDARAHYAALQHSMPTCAVLGCGVNVVYPSSHHQLYREICEQGGALISEFPPDQKPERGYFPRRNRLLAALARAVVVVQCKRFSGAMNTAAHAQRLNKPLFTFPGRPSDILAGGPHQLIREGAQLLPKVESLHHWLQHGHSERQTAPQIDWLSTLSPQAHSVPNPPSIHPKPEPPSMPPEHWPEILKRIWQTIDAPIHINTLALRLSLPIQKLYPHLLHLELEGWLTQTPDQLVQRQSP
ncbi:MAG: DNA-processing protein DprA [Myxococcota bacterium]